jgi:hypothetical protein
MKGPARMSGWRGWLATMPAIGVAVLPRFT